MLVALLSFALSHASAEPACFARIAALNAWPQPTAREAACLSGDPDFGFALEALCTPDGVYLSPRYLRYRAFESQYREVDEVYRTATDVADKAIAQFKMIQVSRDWRLTGFREVIDQAIERMTPAITRCLGFVR